MEADALLRAAQNAGTRREYVRALELCRRILRIPHRPLELTAATYRLKCTALAIGLRQPGPEAVLSGQQAVRAARRTHDPVLVVGCLADAVRAALYSREYRVAADMARELAGLEPAPGIYAETQCILGWVHFLGENYGLAAEHYHRAAAADPGHVDARHGLALVEARRGRPWRALQLARQSLELSEPGNRHLHCRTLIIAAWAYLEMADFRSATHHLNQARTIAEVEGDGALMARYYLLVAIAAIHGHSPDQARFASDLAMAEALRAGRLDLYDLVNYEMARVQDQEQWPDVVES